MREQRRSVVTEERRSFGGTGGFETAPGVFQQPARARRADFRLQGAATLALPGGRMVQATRCSATACTDRRGPPCISHRVRFALGEDEPDDRTAWARRRTARFFFCWSPRW